jgi:hypothetical protein
VSAPDTYLSPLAVFRGFLKAGMRSLSSSEISVAKENGFLLRRIHYVHHI